VPSSVSRFARRPVAVLGASGFLGGRIVAALAASGAHVSALARGTATSVVVPKNVRLVHGDIRRSSDVEEAVAGAETIFVLAGRSGASESFRDPHEDLDINVGGLLTLLQTLVAKGVRSKIVFPGSRLEYGSVESIPVSEDVQLRPNSPYAMHKALCEEYLRLYHSRFGIRYAIARLTNPYGPVTTTAWRGYNVINHFIARALASETIALYGDGSQLRDYIYVDDAIEALCCLADAPDPALTLNVGSGVGISMAEAAHTIVRICGSGRVASVDWPPEARSIETGDFVADIRKMREMGWEPKTSFEDGVRRTINAYQQSVA